MWKASLRSVLAHRLRLALSAIAVVLGVAFVCGTLVFTDTLSKTFDSLFDDVSADVTVKKDQAFDTSVQGQDSGTTLVPADLVATIAAVPGVAKAEGDITVENVRPVRADGKLIRKGGAPGFGIDFPASGEDRTVKIISGRAPADRNEIVLDEKTADKGDVRVDDRIEVLTAGPQLEVTVVGIFKFGDSGNLAGASVTGFTSERAHELLGSDDFTEIRVDAKPGQNLDELKSAIQSAIPGEYTARTHDEQAKEDSSDIKDQLGFLNGILLAFALIAVFVGTFIIFNTFTMLVAQRTRELALLRALGASKRQVTRSVLIEAAVVGLVGSALGVLCGIGIAKLLRWLFGLLGADLGDQALVVQFSTVVTGFLVGVPVTMIAAYFPARRAAKVPPVAAMTDDVAMPERSLRLRGLLGAALTLIGAIILGLGLSGAGSEPAALVGAGAFGVFLGVTIVSPLLSRPFVRLLGAPLPRTYGTIGRLAVANAQRNPRRTAATASALMIGLALIGTFGVMAASINASIGKIVNQSLEADFIIRDPGFIPFSPDVANRARDTEGVRSVTEMRQTAVQIDGDAKFISAATPDTLDDSVDLTFRQGGIDGLSDHGLLIDENVADDENLQAGDSIKATFLNGTQLDLRIGGVYERNDMLGGYLVSLDTAADGGTLPVDFLTFVNLDDGADAGAVHQRLEDGLKDNPAVEVEDQKEYTDALRGQVNQLLVIIYILLAMAIVIAILGIINTLALSVTERTREIGLMRAIGMGRRQLRRMIRLESVVMAIFGSVLGLVVGLGFGVALQHTLADEGISELRIPFVQLIVFLVVAGLVGVLAALWPAWRAAKMDVLRAISTH